MISLPVWVFEPTSFLQIMAEPFQFEDLLRQAATAEVTYERLQYLVAWNVALYSQASRISTPFVSYPQRNLLIHFLVKLLSLLRKANINSSLNKFLTIHLSLWDTRNLQVAQ